MPDSSPATLARHGAPGAARPGGPHGPGRLAGAIARSWTWNAALCLAAVLLGAAAPQGCQEGAMAKQVIFSAVSGKVLQDGKPVSGAIVEREYRYASGTEKTGKDSTTTGPDGGFTLPKIEFSSFLLSWLPHEVMIAQVITIRHDGKAHQADRKSVV